MQSLTISPLLTTIILSTLQCKTSSNLCSIIITVFSDSFLILSISSIARLPVAGSRLARGSSNKRIFDSAAMTPPKDTLCFCPPDNLCGE